MAQRKPRGPSRRLGPAAIRAWWAPVVLGSLIAALGVSVVADRADAASGQRQQIGPDRTTLLFNGPAFKRMREEGVRLDAIGSAGGRAKRIVLPVARGRVGDAVSLAHRGGFKLLAPGPDRRQSLRVTGLRLKLGAKPGFSARLGGKRRRVFNLVAPKDAIHVNRRIDSVRVRGRLTLTRSSAARLRSGLGLRRTGTGLGEVRVNAEFGPGGGKGTIPLGPEPPLLARPPTAVDLSSASVTWHVRDSFIRYVNAGEGTLAYGGAVPGPAVTTPESGTPLVYEFHFPFQHGWYDPPSGVAGVYFQGAVNFSYAAHGINFSAKNPEIEINGAGSRAIFRFSGSGSTDFGDRRAVLVDLHPDQAQSATVTPDGRTFTYEVVPGTIPQGTAASVFASYYLPGEPFGWVTVSFTRP